MFIKRPLSDISWLFGQFIMVDFQGQKRVLIYSIIIFAISIPASIVFAIVQDNFRHALYFCAGVTVFAMVLFGPNWPWLNINPPNWKDDSEALKANIEDAKTSSSNQKGPRRNRPRH